MPTILDKLRRYPKMNLARMQNLGGLRAIVSKVSEVERLHDLYVNSKDRRFRHELESQDNYIEAPKDSGYRGVHLVYKYKNTQSPQYDGLRLELQIRTKLQHVWATAVETMGTITKNALKSSQGPTEWLDFFATASSAFALIEKRPTLSIHAGMTPTEINEDLRVKSQQLRVVDRMIGITAAASHITNNIRRADGEYHLIILNPDPEELRPFVQIRPFRKNYFEEANSEYMKVEKEIAENDKDNRQAVLVSAGSILTLKKAYPNFFLDVTSFLSRIRRITGT